MNFKTSALLADGYAPSKETRLSTEAQPDALLMAIFDRFLA